MEPEVFDHVAGRRVGRLVRRRVPRAARDGRADLRLRRRGLLGGRRHPRVLRPGPGRRAVRPGRRRHRRLRGLARRLGRARAPTSHPDAVLKGPLYIGDYAKVEAGAELREFTVLGSNVVVEERRLPAPGRRPRQRLHRPADQPARPASSARTPTSCAAPGIEEGVVIGDECVIEEEAIVSDRRARLPVQDRRGRRRRQHQTSSSSRAASAALFGPRGVSGIVNVEITPELARAAGRRLGDHAEEGHAPSPRPATSPGPRGRSSAPSSPRSPPAPSTCVDLEVVAGAGRPAARPRRATRRRRRASAPRPGSPRASTSSFLDDRRRRPVAGRPAQAGADLRPRRVPARLPRRDRRPVLPAAGSWRPTPSSCCAASTRRGVAEAGLKVVVDTGGGTASLVLPSLLGRLGRRGAHRQQRPRRDVARPRRAAERARGPAPARPAGRRRRKAAFGVHFDPVGERLVAGRRAGRGRSTTSGRCSSSSTWWPPSAAGGTRRPAGHHDPGRRAGRRASTASRSGGSRPTPAALTAGRRRPRRRLRRRRPRRLRRAASSAPRVDGIAAFVQLVGLVARTQLQLSEIDARIPQSHVVPPVGADAVGGQGRGHARGRRGRPATEPLDTTDGVRVVEADGSWALVLPDPAEPVTHVWAEAADDAARSGAARALGARSWSDTER